MGEAKLSDRTIEEYLAQEERSEVKSEYTNGEVRAMSGGTLDHSVISSNIGRKLGNKVQEKKLACTVFNSDARVYIETANSFVYPDVSVMCGDTETSEHDRNSYINPILIVEVLSESTGLYDRGDKFRKYRSLYSFKEYVLIDQYKPVVDVLYREDKDYWKMTTTIGFDKSIYLHTLDGHIAMQAIYANTRDVQEAIF